MYNLMPTQSLAKRMGIQFKPPCRPSTTLLGDWYCNDLILERKQFVLCVCSHTRLGILLKGAPYATIANRLPVAVREILVKLGIPGSKADLEIGSMADFQFAKTSDRSILGTLNDYRRALEWMGLPKVPENEVTLNLSLYLAGHGSLKLADFLPSDATLKAFVQPPRPRLRLITG